jgi:hypothetical protein
MAIDQERESAGAEEHSEHRRHVIRIKVQTPRGLWSMDEPKDATKRPEYPISTTIEQVIQDARSVFKFVEQDSKYTLLRGNEILEPQRTLASYKVEDGTLLVLSVQGGNA